MSASAYPTVTVTMLRSSWWQLIDDYENYCGMGAWDTEVFESVRVAGDEHAPDGHVLGLGEVSDV